jgi:carbamoylphosphate synthase large subunit
MKTRVMRAVRIVLLSIAALMAALGIPVIIRPSHRLGVRGEVVQHSNDDDAMEGA